jgi:hypothetical protein
MKMLSKLVLIEYLLGLPPLMIVKRQLRRLWLKSRRPEKISEPKDSSLRKLKPADYPTIKLTQLYAAHRQKSQSIITQSKKYLLCRICLIIL